MKSSEYKLLGVTLMGNGSNTNANIYGYECICSRGFNGPQCENDHRPCKSNTCWNNGVCNETTFECSCDQAGQVNIVKK